MTTLALGDVAGGIGRGQRLLHAAAVARDLDQADAHADVEDLVLPDEAEIIDRAAHVIGDLARLLQRAAHQQHAEFIAADARHGVRVAHRVAQDLGALAQHRIAGHMAAGVVDGLEAIQVQVAQHVRAVAAVRGVDRFLQPALELAPIDQAGQGIVRRLVGHLPRQAAHLGDIVQQHHRADGLAGLHADRRGRQLDQVLARRPAARISSARRPRFSGVPAASAWRTGSASSLRSASSDHARQILQRWCRWPRRPPRPCRRAAAGLR